MANAVSRIAERSPVNAGQKHANSAVTIEAALPASRTNLRATSAGAKSFEKGLGFALPKKPGTSNAKGKKCALWLGPDEWLLIDEAKPEETMVPRLPNKAFSAVDISHRNTAFIVSGIGVENTLNVGCPRNLSLKTFPVGMCSRTIFGKAEVVLYRTDENTFRLECWRTFSTYVWGLLLEGAKDAHN